MRRRKRTCAEGLGPLWPTLLLAILLLAVGAGLVRYGPWRTTANMDAAAAPIPSKGLSEVELKELLQLQSQESSFRFRADMEPLFQNGEAEGNLNLFNSVENRQSMYVTITREDTGDELYHSEPIPPGGSVLTDRLDVVLEAGTYPATVTAHILDPETGEVTGTIEAAVHIRVAA